MFQVVKFDPKQVNVAVLFLEACDQDGWELTKYIRGCVSTGRWQEAGRSCMAAISNYLKKGTRVKMTILDSVNRCTV